MTSRDYNTEVGGLIKELKNILKAMTSDIDTFAQSAATAESRVGELESELQLKVSKIERLERTIKEIQEKAEDVSTLKKENKALQSELDGIKEQLEKMSETYRELVAEQEATIPVQELLALYIGLLEDVFSAQPHAKALFLLHGKKSTMTRDEITKTAGHEATAMRKALGDLSRAELIDYDVENGTAKLKKRLYPT